MKLKLLHSDMPKRYKFYPIKNYGYGKPILRFAQNKFFYIGSTLNTKYEVLDVELKKL